METMVLRSMSSSKLELEVSRQSILEAKWMLLAQGSMERAGRCKLGVLEARANRTVNPQHPSQSLIFSSLETTKIAQVRSESSKKDPSLCQEVSLLGYRTVI